MAHDERERSFDKALARHLRSAASSGGGAGAPAGSNSQRETCADAETLAAYHERLLLPEEMNSWKEHIAGCACCQEILVQLELTDGISVQVAEEEVPGTMEPLPAMSAQSLKTAPRAAALAQSLRASAGAQPGQAPAAEPPRAKPWRWLAPAGAIAAGLLVWVAVHENQPPGFPSHGGIQIAKNQPPLGVTPSAAPASAFPEPQRDIAKAPSKPGETPSTDRHAAVDEMMRRQKAALSARVATAAPAAPQLKNDRGEASRKPAADAPSASQTEAISGAAQEFKQSSNAAVALPAPPPPPTQEQVQLSAPEPAGSVQLSQAEPMPPKNKATAPPSAPALAMRAESGFQDGTALRLTKSLNSRMISPPGGSVTWRVGAAGLIEFSADKGRTWAQQASGVTADLVAGYAPSSKVCWVAGRKGTILVTTDAGANWRPVTPPTTADVGGIYAVDALHATIWDVSIRESFKTSDGGLTWIRVANE